MRIPREIIEDIKFRNPIEDVISSYVTLQNSGSNMKGLCPFHSEKTPSFTVFTDEQNYHCFGCGAGGDVFTFVMNAENLDYLSAVEFLAKRVGVKLPETGDNSFVNQGVTRSRVIEMNTCAARFFRDMLFDEKIGAPAREYLKKRQLGLTIIKRFGLGYAPDSFNALRDHLRKNGYTDEEMTVGFFCGVSKKNGNLYDYFRNRLMFPLIDVAGNIVAFGGRVLDDSIPKYLNTSDTPAFKKSKMLFALNYAKNNCSEYMILCEGNIDVISLHEAGFENAVATLGTAITPDHARLLKKYTKKVIVSYDGDSAGKKATARAVQMLDEVGLETKVLHMRDAKDPDEFIKKFGKEAFRQLVDESRSKFDYVIEQVFEKYNIANDEYKARASYELCSYAAELSSKVERDIFSAKASKALGVDLKSFQYDLNGIMRKNQKAREKTMHSEVLRQTSGISDRVNRDFAKYPKAARLEEMILGMMMCCPEFITRCVKNPSVLNSENFVTEYGKKLFSALAEAEQAGGFDLSYLNGVLTPDEVSRAVKLITERKKLSNTDAVFLETVESLKTENAKLNGGDGGGMSNDDLLEQIRKKREKTE